MADRILCAFCQSFDYSLFSPALFDDDNAASNREDVSFSRDLDQLNENLECSFCQLILETLALSKDWPSKEPTSTLTLLLALEPFAETLPLLLQGPSPVYMGRYIWVSVHPKGFPPEKNESLNKKYRHHRHCISLKAGKEDLESSKALFSGREVPRLVHDMSVVQDWIYDCEKNHKCHVPPAEFTSGMTFRLIDVFLECVVEAPKNSRYVALSYVWGAGPQKFLKADTVKSFMEPGGLSSAKVDLPATIRDSIQACQWLKERYIWVDALCIIQDSPKDKSEQIGQMGTIYSSATLTLIAACGKDCASGLAGISVPRPSQIQKTVAGRDLITVDQSMSWLFERVPYNTRGWTFQEYALSHRLLIFMESQIFFHCSEALWHEDTALESKHQTISNRSPFIRYYAHTIMPARVTDSRWQKSHPNSRKVFAMHFSALVSQFVSRNLTFESDTLDAFMGIASTFKMNLTSLSAEFHCGLPQEIFGLALLWRTGPELRMSQRREGFPTWSWAGWRFDKDFWFSYGHSDITLLGVVLFYKLVGLGSDTENNLDFPESFSEWEVMPCDRVGFADGRTLTTTLHSSIQAQLGGKLTDEEVSTALANIHFSGLKDMLPRIVVFKTSHARLLVAATPYSADYPYYKIGELSGACLDMAWRATQPEYLDFILIALEGTPELQAPEYLLEVCVLVVEWIDGIAYRVSSCNVRQSDWLEAESKQKIVVLG